MQGYVQVYTGDGKGKTTAALGLALRAAGAPEPLFVADIATMAAHIVREVRAGDVLLCMGAGSIGDVPLRVLELMPAQAVPKSEGGLS